MNTKKFKQKLIINVELLISNDTEPKHDNLESTQDYSQFRTCIIDIIQSQHFHLLETRRQDTFKPNYL